MFRLFLEIGVLLLEAFHTAGGIDKLLFASKEGVATRADFNGEIFAGGGERFDLMPASTGDHDLMQFRVDAFFHRGGLLT